MDIDVEKIEEISKEKDTVVMRLMLLEEERVRLMRKFADDNYITKNMNLEDLAKFAGDNTFSVLRSEMLSLLKNIEEMNKFNAILIGRSIRHIRTTISFFNSFTSHHIPQTMGVLLSKET